MRLLCEPDDVARVDNVLVGTGARGGGRVGVIATDGAVEQGAIGASAARAAAALVARCAAEGRPVVLLLDATGARLADGAAAVESNASLLAALADASGRVPLLAGVFGFAAGSAAYALALCDLAFAIEGRSFVFVAGPPVVEAALGAPVELAALGGTDVHVRSGLLAGVEADDAAVVARLAATLDLLPPSSADLPAVIAAAPGGPAVALPADPRATWDGRTAVAAVVDTGTSMPLGSGAGGSVITALARLSGRAVAVVASQPKVLGGALDAEASRKVARFVRFAAAFNVPVVTLCDTPGFLPGPDQEARRVLVDGAAVIAAYAEARASVPLVAVVLRRAVGAGSVLVLGAHARFGLPGAELVQMGDRAARAAGGDATASAALVTIEPSALRDAIGAALEALPAAKPAPRGGRKAPLVPL